LLLFLSGCAQAPKEPAVTPVAPAATTVGTSATPVTTAPVPTGTVSSGPIVMEPFTDQQLGITGLAPRGWQTTPDIPGVFSRDSRPNDLVRLIEQAAPDSTTAVLASALLPQLGLESLPESTGTLTTTWFTWDLYTIQVEVPNYGPVVVDLALTQTGQAVYIVLLQAPLSEEPVLRDEVFLPAVKALQPLSQGSIGPAARQACAASGQDPAPMA
jgi:hypothetical protein